MDSMPSSPRTRTGGCDTEDRPLEDLSSVMMDVGRNKEEQSMTNIEVKKEIVAKWPNRSRTDQRYEIFREIQDTYDVAEGDNNEDTLVTDNLLPTKKVRWKDINGADLAFRNMEKTELDRLE